MQLSGVAELGAPDGLSLVRAFEVKNGLVTAEAVARACLERTESRGGHYRTDFDTRNDDDWLHALVVRRGEGGMQLVRHDVDPAWKPRRVDMWGKKWG
jgi:succinate dehydrogenase/fumarate reductase flavoprotein subunit